MKASTTHTHHYDVVTHHCQCGAYRFEGFRDDEAPPPSEHFGRSAQRRRDDLIDAFADCE